MPSRKVARCPKTGEQTWIRDCLHDLRDYAQSKGLKATDAALRRAIIEASGEAGVATLLSVQDLVAHQLDESKPETVQIDATNPNQ